MVLSWEEFMWKNNYCQEESHKHDKPVVSFVVLSVLRVTKNYRILKCFSRS